MDDMNEMDDVLQELESGKNPMEFPDKNAKSVFRLRSLYIVPTALFLIAGIAQMAGNNILFSAISVAAVLVGILFLSSFGVLYILNGDIQHKSNHSEKG